MAKRKLWCDRGKTGEMLRALRREYPDIHVSRIGSWAYLTTPGMRLVTITLRGPGKDQRKQARALQRWFKEE